MINLKIESSDTKEFMSQLLKSDIFDNFEVRGIEVATYTKFEISCIKNKDYFDGDNEDISNYLTWVEIKDVIISIIKNYKTPSVIKIVFSIPNQYLDKIHNNAKSLFLNITYENNETILTNGTSQKEFSLDKSLNMTWDEYLIKFFKKNNIKAFVYDFEN